MMNLTEKSNSARNQVTMLRELSEALRQAIGGATQLSHSMRAPQFLMIRQALELMQDGVMELTQFQTRIVTPKKH